MKLCRFHKECSSEVRNIVRSMTLIVVLAISLQTIGSTISFSAPVFAFNNSSMKMTDQRFFVDSHGNLNVVGVVNNFGTVPVKVTVGLNTATRTVDNSNSATTSFIKQPIYGRIIYPFTGAPFKFVIAPQQIVKGKAFIVDVNQIPVPNWNVLSLNYSNMAVGSDKALVGTAKNVGPFDLYDVSVYASVHDKNRTQIDSVKSNVIPIIKPGEEVTFSAVPDSAISPNVTYFSCAGVSLNNSPMTTLAIDKGQSISYDIIGVVRISDFKYNTANDSIMFGVKHYNPDGGPMSLKIVKNSSNPSLSVLMDGKLYNPASVKTMDGKTVHIDFFLSPGDHNVQVKGIKNGA